MSDLPKPPKRPCGSCPYRKDVPSGVWDKSEYLKLLKYDGEIIDQLMNGGTGLFMCHQRDGCLCGGWVQAHGSDNLLALRMNAIDPSTFGYQSDVPTFSSGAEACAHGMRDVATPSSEAQKLIGKISRLPGVR